VFDIARGVIQDDIITPIFFIITLVQLVQNNDKGGKGVTVTHIKEIKILGYADDAAMCAETVEEMTTSLTVFVDVSLTKADMCVKLSKTYNQHLQPLQKVTEATDEEVTKKMASYNHKCEFAKVGCTYTSKLSPTAHPQLQLRLQLWPNRTKVGSGTDHRRLWKRDTQALPRTVDGQAGRGLVTKGTLTAPGRMLPQHQGVLEPER